MSILFSFIILLAYNSLIIKSFFILFKYMFDNWFNCWLVFIRIRLSTFFSILSSLNTFVFTSFILIIKKPLCVNIGFEYSPIFKFNKASLIVSFKEFLLIQPISPPEEAEFEML